MATILRAEERHLPAIGELWKEFNGHRVLGDDLRRMLDDPAVLLLVAVEGDAVIGYAFAKIEAPPPVLKIERRGHIVELFVSAQNEESAVFWRARGYVPWLYGLTNQRPDGGESR